MTSDVLLHELQLLPEFLGGHILLTVLALGTGILFCIPLAILITRIRPLQWPVLAIAGILQTIPGIALLALMVPLLKSIGFLPAFIALLLYSMLPILRNTITGIMGVDPASVEAARGAGMTSLQMLLRVELPLAAPVIIAGVRIATVWVVGTATLSTPVGATSLGNYIFGGLQTQNYTAVTVGCAAAALLAIILDGLVRVLEVSASRRNRLMGIAAGAGLLLVAAAGVIPLFLRATPVQGQRTVVVGAKTFTEQYILAQVMAHCLDEAGLPVTTKTGLGSTILFDALKVNQVDCYVDYSGTIWATIMHRRDVPSRAAMIDEMSRWLDAQYGIRLLGPLGFENTYTLAMRREDAERKKISSIEELSPYAPVLVIGSDYEFFARAEWAALKETYRLAFAREMTFDPSLMYGAVREGKVDVISAYSTDGRIIAFDLRTLSDPQRALPPYDAVLLLSPSAAKDRRIAKALMPLLHAIDDTAMREANKIVDVDRRSVEEAAGFLGERIDGGTP